ncbi:MAG: Crp/Fnr family transcriptional regulator [Ruminococcaceae bacterium]|nr:Crp/Fnr family transcriptional regulator [Oscillospiraceae bacterium]
MKNYYHILKKSKPFSGFTQEELDDIISFLNLSPVHFAKGSTVFNQGDLTSRSGILLEGKIIAESVSYSGVRRVIQTLKEGDLFGDVLMYSENQPNPVSTLVKEDSKVVLLDITVLMEKSCNPLCRRMLINILHGLADKFWTLNRKIAYLSCNQMRQKIAMFILDMQKKYGSQTFIVEYSREDLAALLGVNRSALSRELSRMQQEEIISYYKSSFKIENTDKLKACL